MNVGAAATERLFPHYMGRRRKTAKKGTAYLIGDAAGLATVDLAEGIGPAVESGLLAARDVCGKGSYSLRSISSYSLPFMDRVFLPSSGDGDLGFEIARPICLRSPSGFVSFCGIPPCVIYGVLESSWRLPCLRPPRT